MKVTGCQRVIRKGIDDVELCNLSVACEGLCAGHWSQRDRDIGPCFECKFYRPMSCKRARLLEISDGHGECTKRAPIPVVVDRGHLVTPRFVRRADWPITAPDDECGDFKDLG